MGLIRAALRTGIQAAIMAIAKITKNQRAAVRGSKGSSRKSAVFKTLPMAWAQGSPIRIRVPSIDRESARGLATGLRVLTTSVIHEARADLRIHSNRSAITGLINVARMVGVNQAA